ncbi:MAG TPA: hypothetical protein VGQ81_03730 [Acidobacteriota bacterium]|jgi:hypothetical protein|nr:hypothetical protein [Acidobacteriota bacterium]
MRTVSWILLALVGLAILLGSLGSANFAYRTRQDSFANVTLDQLTAGQGREVAQALLARRGTAAAYAAGFAILFLFVVLVPYRRGEVWAWWAILAATLGLVALTAARIPFLGTRSGVGTAWIMLAVVGVGLLLDIKRLWSS